jgi:hypothetical protein
MLGRLPKQPCRFGLVRLHALVQGVADAEGELREGMALLCRL